MHNGNHRKLSKSYVEKHLYKRLKMTFFSEVMRSLNLDLLFQQSF